MALGGVACRFWCVLVSRRRPPPQKEPCGGNVEPGKPRPRTAPPGHRLKDKEEKKEKDKKSKSSKDEKPAPSPSPSPSPGGGRSGARAPSGTALACGGGDKVLVWYEPDETAFKDSNNMEIALHVQNKMSAPVTVMSCDWDQTLNLKVGPGTALPMGVLAGTCGTLTVPLCSKDIVRAQMVDGRLQCQGEAGTVQVRVPVPCSLWMKDEKLTAQEFQEVSPRPAPLLCAPSMWGPCSNRSEWGKPILTTSAVIRWCWRALSGTALPWQATVALEHRRARPGQGNISGFGLELKSSPRNCLRDQGQTIAERLDCFFGMRCSPESGVPKLPTGTKISG